LFADFEGANASKFIKTEKDAEFNLMLKSDSNTKGFAQWFFFCLNYKGAKN